MNTSLLFEASYCNQLLDDMTKSFHDSSYGPNHLKEESSPQAERLLSKKFIQLAQINVALTQIILIPHLDECFQRLSILRDPYLKNASFLNEMNSFFTSDYGDNLSRNYAVSLKRYIEFVRYSILEFLRLKKEIFGTDVQKWKIAQVDAFRRNVQRKIKAFLIVRETHFIEVFDRLEVYVEKKRFHKLMTILESGK
jgi:hypothetical protein